MSRLSTDWRITVAADTAAARSDLKRLARTADKMGVSMEQMFSNVQGAPVARTFKNVGRELDRMNSAVIRGKAQWSSMNNYWRNSNNLIRQSKQLQQANWVAMEKTNGSVGNLTLSMRKLNEINVSTIERLAYMNTWFRSASTHVINWAKNIQWAGRQILVGFGVPFGLAMTGAAMAFLDFEEQVVRFRKVFNDEINDLSIEEAEKRIINLANTMSTSLGIARTEVLETSAVFAQMGYRVEDIERLTKATTELAMLGETDPQSVAQLLRAYSASGFVDTFVAQGNDRNEFEIYVKDMLNAIENNTGLSIANMVESGMAQLIPLFSQTGIGMGIGESILAGMSEALGGRSREAVTAIKAIIQRVYDESAETTEQFDILGVDINALQNQYKDDFVGLITELGDILANNPDIQNNNKLVAETFGNLFGIRQANRAIAGLRAVSTAFDSAGNSANDYGRALESFEDRQEIARRSQAELEAQAESLGGRLRRLKETVLIAATDLGETALEMIMPLLEWVKDAIEWFTNLDENTKRLAIGIGGLVVGLSALLTTVGVLAQAFMYLLRGISALIPGYDIVDEKTRVQQIAMENLDTTLKGVRGTVNELTAQFRSMAAAEHAAAVGADRLRASTDGPRYTRLANGSFKQNFDKKQFASRQEVDAYYGQLGTQRMIDEGYAPRGKGQDPMRDMAPGSRGRGGVTWRKSAATLGTASMLGSMFTDGKTSATLMGAGVALEMTALMPSLLKSVKKVSSVVGDMTLKMSLFAKGIMTGTTSFSMMANSAKALAFSLGPIGIAVGLVAAAAYQFKKRLDESTERAKEMRSEFAVIDGIMKEMNITLTDSALTSGEWNPIQSVDTSEMSEEMAVIVERAKEAERTAGDSMQRVFRNIAREMMAGGATIEEINKKLDELEAEIDITIDEVNTENLTQALVQDTTNAMNMAFSKWGRDRNWFTSIWASAFGRPFNAEDTQVIQDIGLGMANSIENAVMFGSAGEIDKIVEQYEEGLARIDPSEVPQFEDAMADVLGDALGLPKEDVENLKDVEEVLKYFATNALADPKNVLEMDDDVLRNVQALKQEYGEIDDALYEAAVSQQELEDNMYSALNQIGSVRDAMDMSGAYRRLTEHTRELVNTGKTFGSLMTSGKRGLLDSIKGAKSFRETLEDGTEEARYLDYVIATLEARLENDFNLRLNISAEGLKMAEDADRNLLRYAPSSADGDDDTGDYAEEAAEDDVESYVSAFRSALDDKRDEIIDSILESFDEATEAIIERLEEQKDAEVNSLEERKQAIDDYLEKQKEINEAMQGQIDLSVALASGDRGAAAQIQNSMRFGNIEKMAEEAIDSIDEEIDKTEQLYDNRIEREEELREQQKETLEQQLEGLEDMFLGSQADWDRFYNRAKGMAVGAGVELTGSLSDGFTSAMAEVEREMDIDAMWENAHFPNLERIVKEAIENGAKNSKPEIPELEEETTERTGQGLRRGITSASTQKHWDGWMSRVIDTTSTGITRGTDNGVGISTGETYWDQWFRRVADSTGSGVRTGGSEALTQIGNELKTDDNKGGGILDGWMAAFGIKLHTGGNVGGGAPRDVPAILQTGEYVIQRKAAQELGPDILAQMNNAHKYHTGGEVGGIYDIGKTIGRGAGSAIGAMMNVGPAAPSAMDPGKYGGRSWGKAAPNTLAAQKFINEMFAGVRGAYTSVDRGNPRSDHSWGKALDVMTATLGSFSDDNERKIGWQVAEFFQNNPDAFGTKYVIWDGLISSRSKDGLKKWRPYTSSSYDVSSPTGGHYDHVHVSFLHDGGYAGSNPLSLAKGGRLKMNNVPATLHKGEAVLRAPIARSLEDGIKSISNDNSRGDIIINVENLNGDRESIDYLADKVMTKIEQRERRVNANRRFG